MIIAVIGQKGGCGKSTIAVHLAGWRTNIGKDVLLIDSDRQGHSPALVTDKKRRAVAHARDHPAVRPEHRSDGYQLLQAL